MKVVYGKSTANMILNGEKESIFSDVRNKTKAPTTTEHSSGSPTYDTQRRKINNKNPDCKRSKTLTLCRSHDTVLRKP